jgi:uncharacterized protein
MLPAANQYGPIKLVIIQSTSFCNLDCDYCYLPNRHLKQEFSLPLLKPIFTGLFNSPFIQGGFTVVWHAGEPLTMPIAFYQSAIATIKEVAIKVTNILKMAILTPQKLCIVV